MVVDGTVEQHNVEVAIDTGSMVSIISGEMLAKCSDDILATKLDFKGAFPVDAGGNPLKVIGKFEVTVRLGQLGIQARLMCIPGFPYDILLGNDVLSKCQAVISLKKPKPFVELMDTRIGARLESSTANPIQILRLRENIELPARSEVIIPIKTRWKQGSRRYAVCPINSNSIRKSYQ